VSVPVGVEIAVTMKMDNWAFGEIQGTPRDAASAASDRPLGTDKVGGR